MNDELTHIDKQGKARMVDVGSKPPMRRTAVAEGFFCAAGKTLDLLEAGDLPKGEALAVARVAAILAAKKCDELIPLCHTLPLDAVRVDFERAGPDRLRIVATVSTLARGLGDLVHDRAQVAQQPHGHATVAANLRRRSVGLNDLGVGAKYLSIPVPVVQPFAQ